MDIATPPQRPPTVSTSNPVFSALESSCDLSSPVSLSKDGDNNVTSCSTPPPLSKLTANIKHQGSIGTQNLRSTNESIGSRPPQYRNNCALLLSFGGNPAQKTTPSLNGASSVSPVRPSLNHFNTTDGNTEPLSLKYLHKQRYSDLDKNPFLISQARRNQADSNTQHNKVASSPTSDTGSSGSGSPHKDPLANKFSFDKSSKALDFINGGQISPGAIFSQQPASPTQNVSTNTTAPALGSSFDNSISEFPPLIRKKSGEIVKSSLKLSSLGYSGNSYGRSASSLPSTPTYKAVHFNNKSFADIKYFRERDSPTAISAENSPNVRPRSGSHGIKQSPKYRWLIGDSDDDDDSDSDIHQSSATDDDDDDEIDPGLDWEINPINFRGSVDYERKFATDPPVFLERFFLSTDKRLLKGQIATKNIAFQKKVAIKYSLNDWKIVSEVEAAYVPDIPRILKKRMYDRFLFQIPLVTLMEDKNSLDHVDFVACIKYETNGETFWDNNEGKNYQLYLKSDKDKKSQDENSSTSTYSAKYLAQKKRTSSTGLSDGSSLDYVDPLTDTDDFDTSTINNNYDYDDHRLYNQYSESSDSYFPPFQSSPSTPNFKYHSDFDKSESEMPNFSKLGEALVNFKSAVNDTSASEKSSVNDENNNAKFQGYSLFNNKFNDNFTSMKRKDNILKENNLAHGFDKNISEQAKNGNTVTISNNNMNKVNRTESQRQFEIQKVGSERPSFDSKSYKELVENYCFFQG
ncbi:Gip2 protein [Saccharomycopsis crataegensis]|uniref:Gip2 protein n=1 Tax=Saccharomycopsis crataegensis TaxID=43959 RepID=A0AAV5QMU8_9ASCO|nr:Gip2 protein [Saccharomycopsis crataegensis]